MPNHKFFKKKGPFTIKNLAEKFNCEIIGNENLIIDDIATIEAAQAGDIAMLHNPKYTKYLSVTRASACIIAEQDIPAARENLTLLITNNPLLIYARVVALFYKDDSTLAKIANSAVIAEGVIIGKNVIIEDFAVIGEGASIGDNCYIGANVYIDKGVSIGDETKVYANVCLSYCIIGKNCIIHNGAKIGQDGFGFAHNGGNIEKILQLGLVIIEDNVEIGANTCVDRGTIEDTIIGSNTKVDNLVQIGHNVVIGKNCLIAGQVGIAGSTKVGDYVMMGGQVGVAGHLEIGDQVKIAAQSGVIQNVNKGKVIGGTPAIDIRDWHKISISLKKMIRKINNE